MYLIPQIFTSFSAVVSAYFFGKPYDFRDEFLDETIANIPVQIPPHPAFADQPHGNTVCLVSHPGRKEGYDALITQKQNLPLLIKTADCIAALMFDPTTKTIAAVHAGWRGLAQKVFSTTCQKLQQQFSVDIQNVYVALSPSIHLPKFSDPYQETPEFFHPFITPQNEVNLWSIATAELLENGIPKEHIEFSEICTYSDPKEKFWSHRRKNQQRNGSCIYLR